MRESEQNSFTCGAETGQKGAETWNTGAETGVVSKRIRFGGAET